MKKPNKSAFEHMSTLNLNDRSWGYEKCQPETYEDGTIYASYRNHDFFTSRPHEEDDDYPELTGKKEIIEKVERHLGTDIEFYSIEVLDDSEKGWFGVELNLKKEVDPTHWCNHCKAKTKKNCNCGPIAKND